jgi:hypothetical protein
MAQSAGTIDMPMTMLTIKVKLPLAYGLRMWITGRLMAVAGIVCPHVMTIEIGKTP